MSMPVDQLWAYLFTSDDDGLTTRWQVYFDIDAARRELGIDPD